MAAHRYWRAPVIETYGPTGLDITEFQLLAGATRVDASAILTASEAPLAGALANLQDDDTSTGATWNAPSTQKLILYWDFGGSPQDVTDIRLGSALSLSGFPLVVRIDYSDDATTWTPFTTFAGISWPGPRTKTTSEDLQSAQILASSPLLYYKLDEVSGTSYADATGNGRTGVGSGTITPQAGLIPDSTGSQSFDSTTAQILTPDPFGGAYTGAWTVRAIGKGPSTGFSLAQRGRDGSGSGWSISLGVVATTGVVGISAVYNGSGYSALSPAGTYSYGTLIELVGQYVPGTGLRVFVNGDLAGAASGMTGSLRDSSMGLLIGMGNSTNTVGTQVDELAWWNTALTAAQIRSMARGGRIVSNNIRGRSDIQGTPAIPTGATLVLPYGAGAVKDTPRARPNFLLGSLGSGKGRVNGRTMDSADPNIPVGPRRVRLYRKRDGLLIDETWSNAVTGAYTFDYIDEQQTYYVVAFNHTNLTDAVIADNRVPSIIPGA